MDKALLRKLSRAPVGAWDCEPQEALEMLHTYTNAERFLVFDTETTGLDTENDFVIQLTASEYERGADGVPVERQTHNWFINPGFAIPEIITKLTGITGEFMIDQPAWSEVCDEIMGLFDSYDVVLGHNIQHFDIPMMNHMYTLSGKNFTPLKVVDTLIMARAFLPGYSHKLIDLANLFEFVTEEDSGKFHDARYDTLNTAMLAEALATVGAKQEKDNIFNDYPVKELPRILYYWHFDPKKTGKNHENESINFVLPDIGKNGKHKQIRFLVLRKQWKANELDLQKIDMVSFEQQAFLRLGVSSRRELADCYKKKPE